MSESRNAQPDYKQWLKDLKALNELQLVIQAIKLTPQEQSTFWQTILALLQSEESPMTQSGLAAGNIFTFVMAKADLADVSKEKLTSQLYQNIKTLEEDGFWNDSLQRLIRFFIDNMQNPDVPLLNIPGQAPITPSVLMTADAGANFKSDGTTLDTDEFVNPFYNIDGNSYNKVRAHDQIYDILRDAKKVQETRKHHSEIPITDDESTEKLERWIRLLMPQYGRRVWVEDLDRNFWVIAQTIAAISAYLFDPNSPLPKTLEGLLRETTEIWENILYLWTEVFALSQNTGGGVRTIVLPLQKKTNENGRRYDYFDNNSFYSYVIKNNYYDITMKANFDEEVEKRLAYLLDQYKEEDLLILPYIRIDNYKHNYYSAAWYPGVYYYNRKLQKWEVKRIYEAVGEHNRQLVVSLRCDNNNPADTTSHRFSPYAYAVRQINNKIIWSCPFSDLPKTKTNSGRMTLYGALRPHHTISLDKNRDIQTLNIDIEDAGGLFVDNEPYDDATEKTKIIGGYKIQEQTDEAITLSYTKNNSFKIKENLQLNTKQIQVNSLGYYLGEIISWRNKTMSSVESGNIFNHISYVIKLGSFLPSGATKDKITMAVMSDSQHTYMKGNLTYKGTASTANSFYIPDWSTYIPSRDESPKDVPTASTKSTVPCFSKIYEYGMNDMTETFLKKQGLIAAKNFLQKSRLTHSPCYVVTAIGLTPWANYANMFYWDNGAIAHIYHYIPAESQLPHVPTDDSYSKVYDDKTYAAIEIDGESGVMLDADKKEIGKIFMCGKINKRETFFTSDQTTQSVYTPDLWRQFQIVQTGDEYCSYEIINGGNPEIDDGGVTYKISVSKIFNGTVDYYDNRYAESKSITTFSSVTQVGMAPVQISESGYKQTADGKIAACNGAEFKARTNVATVNAEGKHMNTGFPALYDNKEFMPTNAYTEAQVKTLTNASFGGGVQTDRTYAYRKNAVKTIDLT